MSNHSSNAHVEDHFVPLAIVFPDQGEDVIVTVEKETLPSIEEFVPRYPDAKPDLHKSPEVVTESF